MENEQTNDEFQIKTSEFYRKSNKTNSYDEILNLTGLNIDKLYQYDKGIVKEIDLYTPKEKDEPFLHDKVSGNFHLLPNETKLFNEISEDIGKKRDDILNKLEEKINEVDKKKIVIDKRAGSGGNIKKAPNNDFKSGGKLFSYIRVWKNYIPYDLMFIRFFIDENKKTVNCILKSFQFCRGDFIRSYLAYPTSADSPAEKRVEFMYYNPEVTFDTPDDKVAECFLNFVKNY